MADSRTSLSLAALRVSVGPTSVLCHHQEMDDSFIQFTRALCRGEDDAWCQFHDRDARRLRGLLQARWFGEGDAVDDLLQETLIRAVRHMRNFDNEPALWSWLSTVAGNCVADRGRKRSRWLNMLDRFRVLAAAYPVLETADSTPEPADFLSAAMCRLDPAAQFLLALKYEEKLSLAEIATRLGCSAKSVERKLHRTRLRLRDLIKSHYIRNHEPPF